MAEFVGKDTTMFILPNGDFVHGELFMVDTTDWSLEEFRRFDDCPPENRVGLARIFDAIRKARSMSVVEIIFDRR